MTTSTEALIVPEFVVRRDGTDISIQLRVTSIGNGYLVKTGGTPLYYATKEGMAKAVYAGLLKMSDSIIEKVQK
jgi:hypothetical protein